MPGNRVTIVVGADNTTTVDLEELKRRLDELKAKRAEIPINVKDDAAKLALARLNVDIDRLEKKLGSAKLGDMGAVRAIAQISAVDAALDGMDRRMRTRISTGIGGAVKGMFTGQAAGQAAGGLLGMGGIVAGAGSALAIAAPLAAATAAAGAFGAVAIPVLSKVAQAQSALNTAQQAYDAATTKAQRQSALQAEAKATAGLSTQQKALLIPLGQIEKAFSKLEDTATPALGSLLKLGASLMPLFGGLVQAGGKLVSAIAGPLSKMLSSSAFGQFTKTLESLAAQAGPVLAAFLVQVIGLFEKLTVQLGPVGIQLLRVLLPAIVQLASDLVPLLLVGAKLINILAQWLDKNHLLVPALGLLTAAFIALKMSLLTNPIFLIATAIITLAVIIDRYHKQIWDFITKIWGDIFGFLKRTWNDIVSFAKQWWLVALLGPAGLVVKYHNDIWQFIQRIWHDIENFFKGVWNTIWSDAKRAWNDITAWFTGIPGKIEKVFSGAGKWLYQAGKDVIQGLWNGLTYIWDKVTHFISSIAGWIKAHKGPLSLDQHLLEPAGRALMSGLHTGLTSGFTRIGDFITGITGSIGGWFGGAAGKFSGSVATWMNTVMKALAMENLPLTLTHNVLYQMQTESGGNPDAINLWDSNAMMGDPSRGLMQVIMSTFKAFHWPGTSWNIYDPLANIAAALNYARHRYGPTLMSGGMGIGSGHGYAGGGPTTGGLAWVGERGRELIRLPAGGHVYPHGQSEAMAAGGSVVEVRIFLDRSMEQGLGTDLLKRLRFDVRTKGGGNVQAAFGKN